MGRNYWMVAATLDEYEVIKNKGFRMFGMGRKYRRRAQRMQPDDRMLLYVRPLRKWTASVSVASEYFEDRNSVWDANRQDRRYPYRVRLKPDILLNEEDYIDAMALAPRMDYLKRWLPELWPLAFFDTLHLIPQKDFSLIEGEMKRIVEANDKRRNQSATDSDAASA